MTTTPPVSVPALPHGVRTVHELPEPAGLPLHVHPGWREAFPWLAHGVTGRGVGGEPFDMALFGDAAARPALERWRALGEALGMPRMVHGRQVHGAAVRVHDDGPPGLQLVFDTDGHATRARGVLLAVAIADCVPITVVDPKTRSVAVLHGGWRGIAAGILEEGVAVLGTRLGARSRDLHVHAGPAICGRCYEVGPEVHEALSLPRPGAPTPVDLRAVVAARAVAAGVDPGQVTLSGHCTRCGDSPFFSHRGGCLERQVAVAGRRA